MFEYNFQAIQPLLWPGLPYSASATLTYWSHNWVMLDGISITVHSSIQSFTQAY